MSVQLDCTQVRDTAVSNFQASVSQLSNLELD